jgi:hypothetical protein
LGESKGGYKENYCQRDAAAYHSFESRKVFDSIGPAEKSPIGKDARKAVQ